MVLFSIQEDAKTLQDSLDWSRERLSLLAVLLSADAAHPLQQGGDPLNTHRWAARGFGDPQKDPLPYPASSLSHRQHQRFLSDPLNKG